MPTEEFINYQSVLVLVFLYQSHEGTAGSIHTTNQALCCHEVNGSTKQVLQFLQVLAGCAALFAAWRSSRIFSLLTQNLQAE